MSNRITGALGATILLLMASAAQAHVTLETSEAAPNTTYKATFRVPHGCQGQATRTLRIRIPEGFIAVKPMPKAGWSLSTVQGRYAAPHDLYGKPVSEGVTEVVWTGALADEHYDEFVLRGRVSGAVAPGTSLAFPVVQECESAAERWVEVPTPGADAQALRHPAPALRIVAPRVVQVAETSATVIVGDLAIEAPWSRATPGGAKVAAGYLKVTNRGSAPDRLIGGSFAAAGRVELHESRTENGVMRMRALERMEIAPGATLELKPGGDHLMLLDLARPLKEGERVKGTLVFERAGTVEVTFAVQGLAARGSGEHHHHH